MMMKNVFGSLFASMVLAACGGDSAPGQTFPAEIVATADQATVRLYDPANFSAAPLATATIPGIPGTYARVGTLVTVTMPRHELGTGHWVTLDFGAGTGGSATSGTYLATVVDPSTFTVTDTATGAITGGTLFRNPITRLSATYVQAGTTMTVTLPAHGVGTNWTVDLQVATGGGTSVNAEATVVDADSFTVTTPTAATASGTLSVGIGTNWATFDTVMHPSGKWLYTLSAYDCSHGNPYCYQGDVITQFDIDWATGALTYKSSVRSRADDATDAEPMKAAFNAAGDRMAVQDLFGGIVLWSVDATTGALAILAESAGADNFGIAFSADGKYVHNGSNVFEVGTSPDSIALLTPGNAGNSTTIAGTTLFDIWVGKGREIRAFSLTVPATPAFITARGANFATALTVNGAGSLMVVSGWGGLKTYTYDGTTIAAAAPATGSAELQADGTAAREVSSNVMYRSVDLNSAGTMVIASYFTNTGAQGGNPPSGFVLASVTSDGALALTGNVSDAKYARVARYIKQPN